MNKMSKGKRILIVDDNPEIHKDFKKILSTTHSEMMTEHEAVLFGTPTRKNTAVDLPCYRIDSAYQGQEALEMIEQALSQTDPYALAFVDIRMPPGWDGIKTIKYLWRIDPNLQIVVCSAYSDHSWEEITKELGGSENFLILKKPFEIIEIQQLATALTKKWELLSHLHTLVKKRTDALAQLYSLSHATLESVKEGILAIGLNGAVLIHNTNFLKQWNVTAEWLKSEKAGVIFNKLSEQLNDPVLFYRKMESYWEHPDSIEGGEWELKSGVILELFTQLQYQEKKIVGVVYSFYDITNRKKLEEQLLHQATHDVLTGLPNRALFLDRIKQALAHAKRFGLFIGIAHVDVDDFKEINDVYGHSIGDLLLKSLTSRMQTLVRETDTVARFGGDEFVIIFTSQTSEKNFLDFIKRFSEACAAPYQINSLEIYATISAGISVYPRDGRDIDTLLKNADAALYQAKQLGKNRYQFYLEEFNKRVIQHSILKTELGHALEKQELSLQYQPLLNLQSQKIIGVEALLRWNHPTLGQVMPKTLIPIAEETGLIIPIGAWVMRMACQQAKIWHKTTAIPDLKVSVNISPVQFRDKNFVPMISAILKEYELEPRFLELEITENLIAANIKQTAEKMNQLKKIGVRFAIDNFGTGYSSLGYLRYFQFDTVKIDKVFMNHITQDAENASIVEAIIALTKHLGIHVLAEGVEEADQIKFLKQHHGNEVQGFYFSPPLDVENCTQLLQQDHIKRNQK